MSLRVGFVMLVHQALHRAAQVARHWAEGGNPVVIHVDEGVPRAEHDEMVAALADLPDIRFSPRRRCEWGTFTIVAATQDAATLLLEAFPDVTHVFLASGSCLPMRPIKDLDAYLAARPRTDIIESVTTDEVSWTVGGLDRERFTLRFPFSWKKHRRLFDRYVEFQRRIGFHRRIPEGIEPHLGSQWWCLTRQTLSAILEDPKRKIWDTYFSKVWIPDESYFQTLVRRYATQIESRSLTLSKFDFQGKPHIFYDDHLQLLRRSDCFVARKIWPRADLLYDRFLNGAGLMLAPVEPDPRKLDRIFAKAIEQRTQGRRGLVMQSRLPLGEANAQPTCARYTLFQGFDELFPTFETWLEKQTGARVHGRLFHRAKVHFAGGAEVYNGCISASAKLRDYDPEAFLRNLLWSTHGEYQSFMFGPSDAQDILSAVARDPNARVALVSGAWAVPLFHSNLNFARIRKIAARYQRIEAAMIATLRGPATNADVRVWTLAEFIEEPMPILQSLLEFSVSTGRRLTEVPQMQPLDGIEKFIQNLRNQGMNPYLAGAFPADPAMKLPAGSRPRVVVRK